MIIKKRLPHCIVLVGSSNGLERDFQLTQINAGTLGRLINTKISSHDKHRKTKTKTKRKDGYVRFIRYVPIRVIPL